VTLVALACVALGVAQGYPLTSFLWPAYLLGVLAGIFTDTMYLENRLNGHRYTDILNNSRGSRRDRIDADARRVERHRPLDVRQESGVLVIRNHDAATTVLRRRDGHGDLAANLERVAGLTDRSDESKPLLDRLVALSEPAARQRNRWLVAPYLTPNALERFRPAITAMASAFLDTLAEADDAELVGELAYPVVAGTMTELLGVGDRGSGPIGAEIPGLAALFEPDPSPELLSAAAGSISRLHLLLRSRLESHSAETGDDLVTRLQRSEFDGERLAPADVLANCMLLLIHGCVPMAGLITNAVLTLLTDPEQRTQLAREPALIGGYIEEILRLHGPVKSLNRTATNDHDIGDKHVHAGQRIHLDLATINRDPRRFDQPPRLDPTRTPGHLAFGAGPAHCVGAALARIPAQEVISQLIRRYPTMRLRTASDEQPEWVQSTTRHTLHRLPVQLNSA
jgi:cytochrome P450